MQADPDFDWHGRRLGNYRIVAEIGRGGMSRVYKAVRADDQYYKEVAIKLLSPGLATDSLLQRLRTERQILAGLSHPHIAQLLDGGVTESNAPYLVMEYIEGCPIDVYCEERSLPLRARLDLVGTLCSTVHYVHRHLMVHGDIKSNNILVNSDGVVKLLDFGIAQLLNAKNAESADYASHVVALTPSYASPEQVHGEPITTASDIYSLGVLLYRLLTGSLPFELSGDAVTWEAALEMSEQTPELPSLTAATGSAFYRNIARELRGDLDAIVMKALSKAPDERYGSAEQLYDDLRRYLRGRPVRARPDRPLYRFQKLVLRHKAASVATGLAAVALVGGIVATSWQAHVARTERARAERHLNEIRKLTNTYLRDVYKAVVNLPGATAVRKLLVENSLKHIAALEDEARDSLEFQRELAWAYEKFGDVQGDYLGANLGDTEGAVQSYHRALNLRKQVADASGAMDDLAELVRSHVGLGDLLAAQSKLDEALDHARSAVAIAERLLNMPNLTPPARRNAAAAHLILGSNLSTVDLQAALQAMNEAKVIFEELAAEFPESRDASWDVALVNARIAFAYARAKQPDQAKDYYGRSAQIVEALAQSDPLDTSAIRGAAFLQLNIGEAHNNLGQPDAALPLLQAALQRLEHLQRTDPANEQAPLAVAYALNLLGNSYLLKGEPAAALTHLDRAAQIIAAAPPAKPTDIAEIRLLAGSNAFLVGKAHSLMAQQAAAGRKRRHQQQAMTRLKRSVSELAHLTNDPVIGRNAMEITEEAQRLLQTSS
jgi:tRNA A-37 threonylcarbamoyl transferase component Bud32